MIALTRNILTVSPRINSSKLSEESKETLSKFADSMKDMEQTDITVYGHTDNVGTEEANQKVSAKRAEAVADYLKKCGMDKDRLITKGMSLTMPVASNDTEEGSCTEPSR